MPELVARNVSEYVQIAVRLFEDKEFYHSVTKKIAGSLSALRIYFE